MTAVIAPCLFDTVLLVEDEPAHALLETRALKEFATTITHAEDIDAALKILSSEKPSLIVSDLNVPDARGVEGITRLLRAAPDVPLLVLTSSTSLADAVAAMKVGARDFIVKDFGPDFREALGLAMSRVFALAASERERKKLMLEMEALHAAFDSSQDGLAVVEGSGVVSYRNRAFRDVVARWHGGDSDIEQFLSAEIADFERVRAVLLEKFRSLGAGAVWKTQISMAADRQTAFDINLSVAPTSTLLVQAPEAGEAQGGPLPRRCVLWVKDISEDLRRERFQREMVATTSHDLKGPLGAITLSAELLEDAVRGNHRAEQLVIRIGSSARSALNLIDEFLSARRIQEGTFVLRPAQHRVAESVTLVSEQFKSIAFAKGVTLDVRPIEAHCMWNVDRLGFERVLSNLLSNAVKFTPRGGSVTLDVEQVGNALHVRVKDTGCGIEPAEVGRIFERFSRLSRHAGIQGSGIGLFVVRAIVAAHGGKVDVTSKLNEGTMFDVSFPAEPPVNSRGELICLDFA